MIDTSAPSEAAMEKATPANAGTTNSTIIDTTNNIITQLYEKYKLIERRKARADGRAAPTFDSTGANPYGSLLKKVGRSASIVTPILPGMKFIIVVLGGDCHCLFLFFFLEAFDDDAEDRLLSLGVVPVAAVGGSEVNNTNVSATSSTTLTSPPNRQLSERRRDRDTFSSPICFLHVLMRPGIIAVNANRHVSCAIADQNCPITLSEIYCWEFDVEVKAKLSMVAEVVS